MPPNIITGTISAAIESRKLFFNSLNVKLPVRGNFFFLDITYTVIIKKLAINMPGIIPAINNSPIDVPDTTPYTTMGILGGIIVPRQPLTAVNPAEKSVGNPFSCLLYTSDAADEEDSVDLG